MRGWLDDICIHATFALPTRGHCTLAVGSGNLKFEGKGSIQTNCWSFVVVVLDQFLQTDLCLPCAISCHVRETDLPLGEDAAPNPHFILLVVVGEEELSLQRQLAISAAFTG